MFRVHMEQGNEDGSHDFQDTELHDATADVVQAILNWHAGQTDPLVITLTKE